MSVTDVWEDNPLLEATLPVGMLLAQPEVAMLRIDERQRLAQEWALILCEKGDVLQYGGKGAGTALAAFCRGLAALAHQPGGVTFGGYHWCVGSGHQGIRSAAPCAAEIAREAAERRRPA